MQSSSNTSPNRNTLLPALLFFFLCATLLSCFLANAIPVTAYISTSPSAGTPRSASDYEKEGMALMSGRDLNALIALTSEGLDIYPDDAELMCLKAYALRKTGNIQESVDLLNVAIPLDPRPARFVNRGYGLLAMGATDAALVDADEAIILNSSYSPGHGLKSEVLLAIQNLTGSLAEADAALALEPESAHYWHVRGNILARMGDCSGAIESLEHSISLDDEYDLPWPGLPNASVDLAEVKSRCTTPGPSPSPTRAMFPCLVVIAATCIAFGLRRT